MGPYISIFSKNQASSWQIVQSPRVIVVYFMLIYDIDAHVLWKKAPAGNIGNLLHTGANKLCCNRSISTLKINQKLNIIFDKSKLSN